MALPRSIAGPGSMLSAWSGQRNLGLLRPHELAQLRQFGWLR